MRRRPLTCAEVIQLVTEYLENALTKADRKRFEKHVASCPDCDTYLDQMRSTIALTGSLREDELDDTAKEVLLRAFRDWQQTS